MAYTSFSSAALFISPPFSSTSFLSSVLLTFQSTQMLQVRNSAQLPLLYLLQGAPLAEEAQNR